MIIHVRRESLFNPLLPLLQVSCIKTYCKLFALSSKDCFLALGIYQNMFYGVDLEHLCQFLLALKPRFAQYFINNSKPLQGDFRE